MIYQKFLTQTLKEAAKIASQMFGKVSGKTKPGDPSQVLTEADLKISKFLISSIEKSFPDHNIVDEETDAIDKKSEYTWVLDPIDGTANFAHAVPFYGIMVGLLKGRYPYAGGIALPYFGEVYISEKGQGACLGSKRLDIKNLDLVQADIIAYSPAGRSNDLEMLRKEGKIIAAIAKEFHLMHTGSVVDSAMVAQGKYAGELNVRSYIWDNVAQHILIEEAGGIYTDFYGGPMDYSDPLTKTKQNYTYCAGAPSVHKKLQEIIKKVDSGFPPSRE